MLKRLFDITFSSFALLLLLPILLVCGVTLFFLNCRPVIFTQPRPGYKEKTFQICKFRLGLHSAQEFSFACFLSDIL